MSDMPDPLNGEDRELAARWLANQRLCRPEAGRERELPVEIPDGFDHDADGAVLNLMVEDLDVQRAWRLVRLMLQLAQDEYEISQVAIGALETLLHNNGDALVGDVEEAIQADKRFRKALRGIYLNGKVRELAQREGLHRSDPLN